MSQMYCQKCGSINFNDIFIKWDTTLTKKKKKKVLIDATTGWISNIIVSEVSHTEKNNTVGFHLYEV